MTTSVNCIDTSKKAKVMEMAGYKCASTATRDGFGADWCVVLAVAVIAAAP
jgi:hypothetical protein